MFSLLFYDLVFWNIFSVIGAVLIVCGLYMVLWGKSKEMKMTPQLVSSNKENFEPSTVAVVIATLDYDNSDYDNNNHTWRNTNIVTMVHDESSEVNIIDWIEGKKTSIHCWSSHRFLIR